MAQNGSKNREEVEESHHMHSESAEINDGISLHVDTNVKILKSTEIEINQSTQNQRSIEINTPESNKVNIKKLVIDTFNGVSEETDKSEVVEPLVKTLKGDMREANIQETDIHPNRHCKTWIENSFTKVNKNECVGDIIDNKTFQISNAECLKNKSETIEFVETGMKSSTSEKFDIEISKITKPEETVLTDGNAENLEYKYDEKTKSWELLSVTGEVRYIWCAETKTWNARTESEHYRWDATHQAWMPKVEVPVSEECENVDEDGHKIFRDQDGTVFLWDENKKAWFPKIDVDMLLSYQSNYVFNETSNVVEDGSKQTDITTSHMLEEGVKTDTVNKKGATSTWFEMDPNHNTKVYVSNLPLDITLDDFAELMSKCGLINRDPDTNRLKIKLYTEPNGQIKGDGICDYIKMESVQLALKILDDSVYRKHKLCVVQAEFKMRGDYNPALKPKRRKKNKDKLKKMKDKLFDWRPERLRGERSKNERVVIIKNYFSPKTFEEDVKLLLEYQNILREECQKCGTVNKVVLYDRNEEGAAQVNMSSPEEADMVIQMMHKRLFGNRQLEATHWDGKTKYKSFESESEEQKRVSTWQQYLESSDDKDNEEYSHSQRIKEQAVENNQTVE